MTIEVVCNSKTVHTPDPEVIMVQFNAVSGIGSFHYYLSASDAAGYTLNAHYNLTLAAI